MRAEWGNWAKWVGKENAADAKGRRSRAWKGKNRRRRHEEMVQQEAKGKGETTVGGIGKGEKK